MTSARRYRDMLYKVKKQLAEVNERLSRLEKVGRDELNYDPRQPEPTVETAPFTGWDEFRVKDSDRFEQPMRHMELTAADIEARGCRVQYGETGAAEYLIEGRRQAVKDFELKHLNEGRQMMRDALTGRTQQDPNIQQIPVHGGEVGVIRDAFLAGGK